MHSLHGMPKEPFLMKTARVAFTVALLAILAGCAHTSNKFPKSPCACDFKPLNMQVDDATAHV